VSGELNGWSDRGGDEKAAGEERGDEGHCELLGVSEVEGHFLSPEPAPDDPLPCKVISRGRAKRRKMAENRCFVMSRSLRR
jgi:hypothetical protein